MNPQRSQHHRSVLLRSNFSRALRALMLVASAGALAGAECQNGIRFLPSEWRLETSLNTTGFSGDIAGRVVEPGDTVDLRVSGLTIPPNQVMLWVGDYQRVPLWEQRVITEGRMRIHAPETMVPPVGETTTFHASLPILNPGNYTIALGDENGPRSNPVAVTVGTPDRRMTQAEAADLWEQGLSLLVETTRALTDDADPGWQAFKDEVYSADQLAMIEGILAECEALSQTAGDEYRSLDDTVERQIQAFLWNSGLFPMFQEMANNSRESTVSAKAHASASLTFQNGGSIPFVDRRLVHRVLFKIDVLGARLLAVNVIADVANIVAVATGGEGLVITVPAGLTIQGLRFIVDALFPTEVVNVELQRRNVFPSDPGYFHTPDFQNRWIYWVTMEPPLSFKKGLARFGTGSLGVIAGKFLPVDAFQSNKASGPIHDLIQLGMSVFRPLLLRLGVNVTALIPDSDERIFRIKTVADTTIYTHFLDSTGTGFAMPVVGDALEAIGDYFINVATDPSMRVDSVTMPTVDVRAWRETTEEHLAFKHPAVLSGQTDQVRVSLTPFNLGIRNLTLTSIPFPEFLTPHTETVDLVNRNDFDASAVPRWFWFDVTNTSSASDIEKATGSIIRPDTSTHRFVGLQLSRPNPLRISGVPDNQVNQGFQLEVRVNGSTAPLGFAWNGTVGTLTNASGFALNPGMNTLSVSAFNVDSRAAGDDLTVQLVFPDVIDPRRAGGRRDPRTGVTLVLGPGSNEPVELRLWTPPAFAD